MARFRGSWVAWLPLAAWFASPVAAQEEGGGDDGLYLGVVASAALYDVDYQKAVDSTDPANISANAGRILFSNDSADDITWDAGPVLGYRFGSGASYLEIEADLMNYTGSVSGRLPGEGSSPGRNQLGEVWPENWSLAKERSFGLTLRLGAAMPALGGGIYGFAGLSRLDAEFATSYRGCLSASGCEPGQLTFGQETHDEEFDAWIAGVGLEKMLGKLGIRAEVRYTDHGESSRTVPFEDVAVVVPVTLSTSELGIGLGLIWRL